MISSVLQITVLVTFLQFTCIWERAYAGGTPWATPDQEALDEVQDGEILKAVVTSMREWHKRHISHRRKRAESSVCYREVGCFQDSGPFGYLDMLPSPPEEVSTRFFLYSGRARGNSPAMDVPFTNLTAVWPWAGKAFNLSAPTKVIVHGFGGSCNNVWVYEMRSALMTVEECNLICVDWEAGALIPNYVRAAANTRLVGKQLSMLLEGLNKHLGLPFHSIHVIGFSLGAHVAGFAGAELKNLSRITGLDPAAPLFESQDPRARLDSTDAMFVDVIHSNGENLILGGLGSWQPMGHVDFYPNGGRMQKGCTNLFVGAVTDILWSASDVEGRSLCNHRRAYKFFTDSVSPRCHFPSFPCESYDKFLEGDCFPCNDDRRCGNMGYYADRSNGRGTLFLVTRDEEPFCAHQYHVRVESSPSLVPVTSYGKIQLTLVGNSDINETFALTQKDDEELQVGSSLARIAVPHPVLQEPKSVQIMYSAYSGWISSGLGTWNVDKVTLTDSFGKSMSVCKKGLSLESGIPVDLPLYPGECNPPKEYATSDKDNWTTSAPSTVSFQPSGTENEHKNPIKQSLYLMPLNGTENFTKYTPTLVVKIGDELIKEKTVGKNGQNVESKQDTLVDAISLVVPQAMESLSWQPIDYLDSSNANSLDGTHNKRENSRSFGPPIATAVMQDRTLVNHSVSEVNKNSSALKQNLPGSMNWSEIVSDRPRIQESILVHSSTSSPSVWPREMSAKIAKINSTSDSHLHSKSELAEPVLNPKTVAPPRSKLVKAREISSIVSDHYEHNMKWMPALDLNPPPLGNGQTWQHWATETTASSSISIVTETSVLEDKSYNVTPTKEINGESRKLTLSPTTTNSKKTHSLPITIQFFPHRLAAILAQAERYARLTLSFPMTAISKLKSPSTDLPESDQDTSASTNVLYKLNTQFLSESQEDSTGRNPSLQTQRRPKHFTTARPIVGNINTKPSSQSASSGSEEMKNGKTVPASVTAETSYISQIKDVPVLQPRYDFFVNSPQMKDTTQKLHIFVPYTYAYVTDDGQDGTDHFEMPRYIPLLRYPYINPPNSKYIWQSYNRLNSNDNQNSSAKHEESIKVKQFNDSKDAETDYNKFFSIFH